MEPGSVVDSLGPKEGGKPCFKEHGARAFDEHLIELLHDTIGLGGIVDVQVTNCPDITKVSLEFLAYKFPSSVAS